MTTVTKSENNSTTIDKNTYNTVLFGPLGKYAIAGVIMVSIIVTTAIMLNKQLGTAAEDVAAIEREIAESSFADLDISQSPASLDYTSAIKAENKKITNSEKVVQDEAVPVVAEVATIDRSETPVSSAATDKVITAKVSAPAIVRSVEQAPAEIPVTTSYPAKTETFARYSAETAPLQFARDTLDQQWEARIEAHKLEQKQRMSEMFSRIKTLESEQLDQYKIWQDERIEYLREQIARQQEMIEELIIRNKESYEKREARMQRYQADREQLLNRI